MQSLKQRLLLSRTEAATADLSIESIKKAELRLELGAREQKKEVSVFSFHYSSQFPDKLCFNGAVPFKNLKGSDLLAHAKEVFDFCESERLKPALKFTYDKDENHLMEIIAHF